MSVGFRAVQWNRDKLVYDGIMLAAVAAFLVAFAAIYWQWHPPKDLLAAIRIWIRTFGTAAFFMITVILMIGPLARLRPRFLPLLYNRRHLGVLTFLVALTHFVLILEWYFLQNGLPHLVKEMTTWENYRQLEDFPYGSLGIAALLIFLVMAATSHDFWLTFLTPRIWKGLHMAVYAAYALVILHVAVGIMQEEQTTLIPLMVAGSLILVGGLHLAAAWRERATDKGVAATAEGWIVVGPPGSIPDKGARIVAAQGGERIAVFRDGAQIGALTNLCAHQNGPLGEGAIVDGCVTCPWHGYQYRLSDGCAPAPFTEKLVTYRVRFNRGTVEVDPRPLAPGTPAAITIPREAL